MGLFSKLFTSASQPSIQFSSEREAFFAIVYACVAIDGQIDDDEIEALVAFMHSNNYMEGFDSLAAYRRMDSLKSKYGVPAIVTAALPSVKEVMKPTLFATAVDFILADGVVNTKEEALLEDLQKGLGVSEELASKIIDVMVIKNKAS